MTYIPKSHPDKLLIEHKNGILSIADVDDLLLLAVSFHDVGKMNDNFQLKINGLPFTGYSHHAYISTYYLINAFVNNRLVILKRFPFINDDNYETVLIILANIIIGHHGCLRDIINLFNNNKEWNEMIEYLKSINMTENVNIFFKQHNDLLNLNLEFTDDLDKSEFYRSYGSILDINKWKSDAISNYLNTIMTYAELVTGDRRNASGNKLSYRNKTRKRYAYSLENNLEWIFNNFKSDTELNKIRNIIRKLAINNLNKYKQNLNNRVFTLNAPTGSGKTFTMLSLANEIMKDSYDYDIIYALPYLSIIDQTTKIVNNSLRIETLNYTSASDTSIKLQSMMEDENQSNELLEYAFSENCFDHPFIITTFNQLFETLLNNSTSKLMKLKNYKKRIFLIDEFQAVPPDLYYTLINILNEFCKKYDSYAIISTATMPCFGINLEEIKNREVKNLFKTYFYPQELLPNTLFNYNVFNRYRINFCGETDQNQLYDMISQSNKSTLLIVNTIRTSQLMYSMLFESKNFDKIYLLNAHITPIDRLTSIKNMQIDLNAGTKILVISTQVIEAGVDISFPIVYRDAAPPSSVVQACGRGNRNGEFGMIDIYLFLFKNNTENNYDCNMVYHKTMTKNFRNDILNKIAPMTEVEFHKRCNTYFTGLAISSKHGEVNENQNIIEDILYGKFLNIGKYRFIQGDPDAYTIFVKDDDCLWNEYVEAIKKVKIASDYKSRDIANINLKRIRGIVLQNSINIRTKVFETINVLKPDVFGVYKLLDTSRYNYSTGLLEL